MFRVPVEPTRTATDDATVRLDRAQSSNRTTFSNGVTSSPPNKQTRWSGWIARPLPRWVWPVVAAVGALIVLLLPLLFYREPGFMLVVRGVPPDGRVYVDDVPRGIPGAERVGDSTTALIRAHGLKSGVSHTVRVSCGGGDASLYLANGSSVNDVSAQDGEVVNLTVKNCGPPPLEIDYNGKMRFVARGAFLMGDNQGRPNEQPARLVEIDYDYYIDKYEVTNQQYRAFSNSRMGRAFPREPEWDPDYSAKLDHPVAGVSWNDARAYCEEWAKKRLPTEAEWEKAASWDPKAAETTPAWKRRWPWGNVFDVDRANFRASRPLPVGQLADGASAYGVYDMAGNIGEWVADVYQAYPGNPISDPNYSGSYRVLRGGTFKTPDEDGLRTARRSFGPPAFSPTESSGAISYIGFRCAVRSDDAGLQNYLRGAGK
jgi:sulfatase modifying factor 1